MDKLQMSQDELYAYLTAHDVKISRIAELMGKNVSNVFSAFRHNLNNNGRERRFSVDNVRSLNEALPRLASELRGSVMTFGSPQTFTNRLGRTYDPALVEGLNGVGRYLNIAALVQRVLGWDAAKKRRTLVDSYSKVFGNVTKEEMTLVNAELLAVSAVLDGVEVVPDADAHGNF